MLVDGDLNRWGPGFGESADDQQLPGLQGRRAGDRRSVPADHELPDARREPYYIGGPGSINRDVEQRRSAKISITHRVKAAGSHEIKAGIDVENNLSNKARIYSGSDATGGGGFITNDVDGGQI